MDNVTNAKQCADELVTHRNQGKLKEATAWGIKGLNCFDIAEPKNNEETHRQIGELEEAIAKLNNKRPLSQLYLEKAVDDEALETLFTLLPITALNAYAIDLSPAALKYYGLTALKLSLEQGRSQHTVLILAVYALIQTVDKKYQLAHDYAEIALEYWGHHPSGKEIPSALSAIASLALQFKSPISRCISLHNQALEIAQDQNDQVGTMLNFNNLLYMHLAQGNSIKEVYAHTQRGLHNKYGVAFASILADIVGKYSEALLRDCDSQTINALDSDIFPEELPLVHYRTISHFSHLLAYWQGDYERAYRKGLESHQHIGQLPPYVYIIDHYLFFGLSTLQLAKQTRCFSEEDQERVKFCLARLEELKDCNPDNFGSLHNLLNALYHQVIEDEFDQILKLFRDSIQDARINGYTQYEALGNELLGDYLQEIGLMDYANHHLTEAHFLYDTWRCQLKVSDLEKRFPFLESIVTGPSSSTPPALAIVTSSDAKPVSSSSQTPARVELIIESAQALTEKREREELYRYLTKALITHSSASRGLLLFCKGDRFEVACDAEQDSKLRYNEPPNSLVAPLDLPELWIVNQVCEQHKYLLVETANQASFWVPKIPDITRKLPIVSLPIYENGDICGAIYLEQVDLGNANGNEMIDILQLLLSQASVALENVNYYEKIQSVHDELETRVQQRSEELEAANKQLEAFSYSVSHDLQGPLRSIRGFTEALIEDYVEDFDDTGKDYLNRIYVNSGRMTLLIEGLLELSKVSRVSLNRQSVNLSEIANSIAKKLNNKGPTTFVNFSCNPDMMATGDPVLLAVLLDNLLSNAWKFSSQTPFPKIEFGCIHPPEENSTVFYVKDNGIGFDMDLKGELFKSFKRLNSAKDFEGTGIGLATAKRIVDRHQGKIWAEGTIDKGAAFYFTLGDPLHD